MYPDAADLQSAAIEHKDLQSRLDIYLELHNTITSAFEHRIDKLVYQLHTLTEEEIAIIEQ